MNNSEVKSYCHKRLKILAGDFVQYYGNNSNPARKRPDIGRRLALNNQLAKKKRIGYV
jgi:hypothetical protein